MNNSTYYTPEEAKARRHKAIKTALQVIAVVAVAHVAHKGYKAVAPKLRHVNLKKNCKKPNQTLHHLPHIALSLPNSTNYKNALDSVKSFLVRCKQKVA
jgi:predicted exporter